MRILVSGGTGFVGRALVGELGGAGHQCTVLSRSIDAACFPDGVEVRGWDARSAGPLIEWLEDFDAMVHLAGENIAAGRWTAERKGRILDSRVVSTQVVAKAFAATRSPPEIYLQASAVGYYGPGGDEEVAEESGPGSDFLAGVCREWEAASEALDSRSARRILARTGIVLSAAGGALPRMALPFRLFVGGKAGSGRQWMPWIHLADEVGAMRFLLEHSNASGAFNLTAPFPVTNKDFSQVLGKVLRRPSLAPAPAFALRLALGEMASLILTGQRAVPRRLLELGYEYRYPTLEAALRQIYD